MSEESLGRWISLLHRYFHIYLSGELAPYDIGRGQALFLLSLYHLEGITQDELAARLHMDKSTTARALEKLERAGYVRKEPGKNDLRCKRVFLTGRAREIEPAIRQILRRWTDILSADLSPEEFRQTLDLLQRMARNAVGHIQDAPAALPMEPPPGAGVPPLRDAVPETRREEGGGL